ncbi:hypothetical protein L1049_027623 [Liquidambar formosana]|uniref:Uncharacterized protein n=1 Tax=Liquidambar formosana TaxID=63359 RepID=A0AAP0WVN9_LIQFO
MAPGGRSRQRSSVLPTPPPLVQSDTTMAQTTLPTVSRPAELSIPDTVGINNAPSIIKKGRGKAVGNVPEKATRGGRRVPVTIPDGKFKPVGDWAAAFTSEVGVICRQ